MRAPTFSIIIPVHDVSKYLVPCLESIKSQSFVEWECVIVDDGSSDSSGLICDEYARMDSRFRVFHQSNEGVSSARNKALNNAIGEWIWFVDADDLICEDSLRILNSTINRYNTIDTIFFGLYTIEYKASIISNPTTILDAEKDVFLQKVQCCTHQTILYKHELITKFNIRFTVEMKMSEDLEFQYKYLLHCIRPIQISEILYLYRIRRGSACHNPETTNNSYLGNQLILKNMLRYILIQDDKGLKWMGPRMVNRVKKFIQEAAKIPGIGHKEIQSHVRFFIDEFQKIGYIEFNSKTMKLAYFDTRLYYLCYRVIRCLNGMR